MRKGIFTKKKTALFPLMAICLLLTASTPIVNIPEDDTTQIMRLDNKPKPDGSLRNS